MYRLTCDQKFDFTTDVKIVFSLFKSTLDILI